MTPWFPRARDVLLAYAEVMPRLIGIAVVVALVVYVMGGLAT